MFWNGDRLLMLPINCKSIKTEKAANSTRVLFPGSNGAVVSSDHSQLASSSQPMAFKNWTLFFGGDIWSNSLSKAYRMELSQLPKFAIKIVKVYTQKVFTKKVNKIRGGAYPLKNVLKVGPRPVWPTCSTLDYTVIVTYNLETRLLFSTISLQMWL